MAEVAALLIHIERKAVGSMKPSMRRAGLVPWQTVGVTKDGASLILVLPV